MSITVLRQSFPVARKEHECSACAWLLNEGFPERIPISEYRHIVRAKRNGYKIIKGQKYIQQINIQDGEFYIYKAIPEIHEICLKYGYYDDC